MVAAEGADLETWIESGETAPIVVYTDTEPIPRATKVAAGAEITSTGTLGWGGASVIDFIRANVTARAKVHLGVVPTKLR